MAQENAVNPSKKAVIPTACVRLAPIAYSLLVSNRILKHQAVAKNPWIVHLPFGPEKGDKPNRERVLILLRGRIGGFFEEWLVGPVVAIFKAGPKTFHQFLFAGERNVLGSLRRSRCKTLPR